MNYYTYKVTFKDLPGYFYYGYHKDNGKPYLGSPHTWKGLWKQFEPEVQILQWFETEVEAQLAEKSIIKHTWNSDYSLNENVGGVFSAKTRLKAGKRGGQAALEKRAGWHSLSSEEKSKFGKVGAQMLMENKLGIHGLSKEERRVNARIGGLAAIAAGHNAGADNVRLQRGICDPEVRKRKRKPVLCVETGVIYESTMAASKETGVSSGNINSCCRGERNQAGGFHWRRVK